MSLFKHVANLLGLLVLVAPDGGCAHSIRKSVSIHPIERQLKIKNSLMA
jgi:hypothetical protein